MIRTTITKREFEKLTWMTFENIASDINDVQVTLKDSATVQISVLGKELQTISVEDYNAILSATPEELVTTR